MIAGFMGVNGQMESTSERLLSFFHCKKTEISCIDQPHIFLTQLKDHDLLPETLFEKVTAMKQKQKGVYEVLEWLEKEKSQHIHRFWRCVFEDHIIQKYPTIRVLKQTLLDLGLVNNLSDELPDVGRLTEERDGKGKKGKQGKNPRKRSNDDRSSGDSEGPGPSSASASTPTRKKPAKKPSFSTPLKKGDKQEIWTFPLYKTQLPVQCGDKKGTLYRDKLPKGEECILSQKRWFTPSEFEKFGGKEKSKNWKVSIRCRNTPLKKLIEENHLQCPPMERRKRTCTQKSTEPVFISSSESSSPSSETSSDSVEESDSEDFQEQSGRSGGRPQFSNRVEEEEEEEEEDDMADLTAFEAPTLPAICASLTGTLYKDRFASGRRGKSIRTEERWFTPEEFVKEEQTLTDGLWKRDILCHGKTLNFLIKKNILQIHSLLCPCVICSTDLDDLMEQRNDDKCYACHSGGDLVCCDECPRAFHSECHLPAVPEDSSGDWFCTFCVLRTSQQWRDSSNMTEQEAFDSPVFKYLLQCHYLLLCMYKEDTQRVFVEDPRQNVERYAEFISQPMWLDRIKQKLETNKYQTVKEFVSDFRLIIQNCSKFNQGNEFDQLGTTMKKIFDEEFQKIFSIQ